jgi:hypothetical protein
VLTKDDEELSDDVTGCGCCYTDVAMTTRQAGVNSYASVLRPVLGAKLLSSDETDPSDVSDAVLGLLFGLLVVTSIALLISL